MHVGPLNNNPVRNSIEATINSRYQRNTDKNAMRRQ